MKRLTAGILVVILIASLGAVWWYRSNETSIPKKPPLWGLHDPPAGNNLTWQTEGKVQMAEVTMDNAASFYGDFEGQLIDLGYSMMMGNWSSTKCQWSIWNSGVHNRTYYIAYNGSRFLAIRGHYPDVMKATEREWLCQNPSNASPISAPSPEVEARAVGLKLGSTFMAANASIEPANWTGPMPDWYLGRISFKVNIGSGVEVLILTYTSREQAEYAAYQIREKNESVEILRNYGGQYYTLIVLKGAPKDVSIAAEIIRRGSAVVESPGNSTPG